MRRVGTSCPSPLQAVPLLLQKRNLETRCLQCLGTAGRDPKVTPMESGEHTVIPGLCGRGTRRVTCPLNV